MLLSAAKSFAQKTKKVIGESHVKIEINQTRLEAEEMAEEQAKVDALISTFGQYIGVNTKTMIESGQVDFKLYGGTNTKGEWIRTIGKPEFRYDHRGAETWITCKIKGEARGITPKADIKVEVLSCPQKKCRTDSFKNNERMYLYVKSSCDGYLSIFMDDGETAYRLLPYRRMGNQKSVKIEGDKEYILFSREIENFDVPADMIELFTDKDHESNTIIAVFSENDFSKPLLYDEKTNDKVNLIVPKSLSKEKFEEWLGNNRAADEKFLDIENRVTIKNE